MTSKQAATLDNLAGVLILAGGLSTRMGSPKALLTLPSGETLIDYHVRHASQLGVPVVIADNEQGFQPAVSTGNAQVSYVQDYRPQNSDKKAQAKHSAGPLGAIVSGLQHFMADSFHSQSSEKAQRSKWLMVISCDSLISAIDVWHCITDQRDITQETAGVNPPKVYCLAENALGEKQHLYPLLALYQLSLTEVLQSYLDAGERRVMSFINPICHTIDMPKSWDRLSNLNTPEQFELACETILFQ